MDDDEFDDGLNDDLLLQEIENFDTLTESNNSAMVRQSFDTINKPQHAQVRQLSIFESFGIDGPAATKVEPSKVAARKLPIGFSKSQPKSKPAFTCIKPSIAYEPKAHHDIDMEAFKTWIYPVNYPLRDYQFNIVQKALYSNTLVALPTGVFQKIMIIRPRENLYCFGGNV
jgi:hypothetical protein